MVEVDVEVMEGLRLGLEEEVVDLILGGISVYLLLASTITGLSVDAGAERIAFKFRSNRAVIRPIRGTNVAMLYEYRRSQNSGIHLFSTYTSYHR